MKNLINVLLIEDDDSQINLFQKKVKNFFSDTIKLSIAKNTREALLKITDDTEYQIFIIDLKLEDEDDIDEFSGNQLVKLLRSFKLSIIAIHSGNLIENDDEENIYFKKYIRGNQDIKDILDELIAKHNSLYFHSDFYNYVNNGLMSKIKNDKMFFLDSITMTGEEDKARYYASLLEHIIYSNKIYGTTDKVNGNIMYIPKTLVHTLSTGCFIKRDDKILFLITPACDLANNKTNFLHFIQCIDLNNYVCNLKSKFKGEDGTLSEKGIEKVKEIKRSPKNISESKFALPSGQFLPYDIILDLHEIVVLPHEEKLKTDIICQLIPRVTKDIIQRFGNLYGRQGSPDFNL